MLAEKMHFTGTIWRPPYEANSQLLQVTTGCSHAQCKFCSLYPGLKFKISPKSEIESDLKIIRHYQPKARRLFLVGANPFVLSFNRLFDLAILVRKYLPECKSIGGFARITDIKQKTVEELKNLRHLGFNGISIGTESGDDITLIQMNKGVLAEDILTECRKLEEAGIEYYFSYLNVLAGHGNGQRNALKTAEVFNQLHPFIISVVSLTVFPDSELYQEVQEGKYMEANEHERLEELKTLVEQLTIKTYLFANTVSNPVPISGALPEDKPRILREIQSVIDSNEETKLKAYRQNIKSL